MNTSTEIAIRKILASVDQVLEKLGHYLELRIKEMERGKNDGTHN